MLLPLLQLWDNFVSFSRFSIGEGAGGEEPTVKEVQENLKKALTKAGEEVDKKLEKLTENFVKGDTEAYNKLKGDFEELAKNYIKTQDQLDKLEIKNKELLTTKSVQRISLRKEIYDILEGEETKTKYKGYYESPNKVGVAFDLKASTVLTTGLGGTEPIPTDDMPGIVYAPERAKHIRDLMSVIPTKSNAIAYMEETAYTDGTDRVAEGASYAQSDFTLTKKTKSIEKIGAYLKISNEMLEDVEYITGYISARLPYKLLVKEDEKLLYGTGSSDIEGLTVAGTAWADPGVDVSGTPNRYDVLRLALKQAKVAEYSPTAILVHPEDAALMDLTKDDNGMYVFPMQIMKNGVTTIKNVPVIELNAMTEGDFLVGDFQLGAHIAQKRKMELKFWQENEDDALKDLTTVTISERIANVTTRPDAFVYGDFATAIGNITEATA